VTFLIIAPYKYSYLLTYYLLTTSVTRTFQSSSLGVAQVYVIGPHAESPRKNDLVFRHFQVLDF